MLSMGCLLAPRKPVKEIQLKSQHSDVCFCVSVPIILSIAALHALTAKQDEILAHVHIYIHIDLYIDSLWFTFNGVHDCMGIRASELVTRTLAISFKSILRFHFYLFSSILIVLL